MQQPAPCSFRPTHQLTPCQYETQASTCSTCSTLATAKTSASDITPELSPHEPAEDVILNSAKHKRLQDLQTWLTRGVPVELLRFNTHTHTSQPITQASLRVGVKQSHTCNVQWGDRTAMHQSTQRQAATIPAGAPTPGKPLPGQ